MAVSTVQGPKAALICPGALPVTFHLGSASLAQPRFSSGGFFFLENNALHSFKIGSFIFQRGIASS